MGTNSLDQALALLDRRYGLVAVHKGLVPRQSLKRILREYSARSKAGKPVSVWELMQKEGFLSEAEIKKVMPVVDQAVRESTPAQAPDGERPADLSESRKVPAGATPKAVETGIELTVREDKMTASINAKPGGLGELSLDELKEFLVAHEVCHGLVSDEELAAFLAANAPGSEMIVAHGTLPKTGQPDELQCQFETDPHRIGTLLDDGTMDWKDRGEIPQASEGDLLAEIKPGRPGRPGVDVHGHVVAPEELKKMRVRAGKGAAFDEEGTSVFATRDGQPYLSLENQISVMPVLKIKGDVGIETGHVEYDGHVEVPGTVQTGYRVRAESLAAGEIHSDDVVVTGDILVRGGIYGARIKAGGNLKAHHVNRSDLLVQGDIVIKKELVESKARAGGRCLLDGGVILSSEVAAAKGISSGSIGAESANDSFLQVGKDPWIKEAIAERRGQLQESTERKAELANKIEPLKTARENVGTELGEIAQVQDKKMVARRELQELIKKEKRKPTAKELVQIKTLGREVDKIDLEVARLMEEEERIDAELVASKQAEVDCFEACERLKLEIDSLTAAAKTNPSYTQIKITGKIFESTDIQGFHAKLRIKETISRCVISEKLDTDPNSSRKWYMAINPL
jgi:uncharacterized protein (DUF342 family)